MTVPHEFTVSHDNMFIFVKAGPKKYGPYKKTKPGSLNCFRGYRESTLQMYE